MLAQSETSVAFFGATGGCTLAALIKALKAGNHCSVLARNPDKLKGLLEPHGLNLSQKGLSVTKGDIRDTKAVIDTLTFNGAESCAAVIVSGIGTYPKLQASFKEPIGMVDATICADAAESLVKALRQLRPTQQPTVVALSTTGLDKKRDVPRPYLPLYHVMLAKPHVDKAAMEKILDKEAAAPDSSLAGLVIVKPTLLMGGAAKGPSAVRAGWDSTETKPDANAPGPAIGYSVTREDVGHWIYDNVVAASASDRMRWSGRRVSLTN